MCEVKPPTHAKLLMSHCIFPCHNLQMTSSYYQRVLGFEAVEYLHVEQPHICLYRDRTEIILIQANCEVHQHHHHLCGYGYDAYFITEQQFELFEEFLKKGVKVVQEPKMTDYHNHEFVIEDVDGRWIAFGIKQKGEPIE